MNEILKFNNKEKCRNKNGKQNNKFKQTKNVNE